jgi:hypothetical protein
MGDSEAGCALADMGDAAKIVSARQQHCCCVKKNSQNRQRLTQPESPAPAEYQLRRMGASAREKNKKRESIQIG